MPEIQLCRRAEYHDAHIWQPAWINEPVQCPGLKWQILSQSVAEAEKLFVSRPDMLTNHSLTGMAEEQADWNADEEEDDRCQPIGCDNGHHLPGCLYRESLDMLQQDWEELRRQDIGDRWYPRD